MSAPRDGAEHPATFRGKLWFWAPILPLIALDLWSKAAVFAFLERTFPGRPVFDSGVRYPVWSVDDVIRFDLVGWHNTGTIWGLGQDMTEVLIGLRAVALVLIVYFARRLSAAARLHQLVLGMIMAGALGNLYDNLTEPKGGVRDFLLFSGDFPWAWQFPAFNVADSCICVGAFTLAFLLWRTEPRTRSAEDPQGA